MRPKRFLAERGRPLTLVGLSLCWFLVSCAEPRPQVQSAAEVEGDAAETLLPPLVPSDEEVDRAVLRAATAACSADPAACTSLASALMAVGTPDESLSLARIAADSGCSRGDAASCEVADALNEPMEGTTLEARIWETLLAACVARASPECAGVTRWYLVSGTGDRLELERLGASLTGQCTLGAAAACGGAGDVAWIHRLPSDARALYERGCEGGDGQSCWMLAWGWGTGAFGAQDRARAAERFREACYKGHARACLWGASALAQGWGHEQELYVAGFLLDLACLRGEPAGCGNLGDSVHAYTHGAQARLRSSEFRLDRLECVANTERCFYAALQSFLASRDVEALRRVADVTCQRGEYAACITTEVVRRLNLGAVRPAPNGVFREPCERGEYGACLALESAGATWSLDGAQRACDRGNLLACLDVTARVGARPDIVPIVVPRQCSDVPACTEADVQCGQGTMGACLALGYHLAFDGSVSQEPGRAARTFLRACEGGSADACYRIGQLELATGDADARARAIRRIHQVCRTGHALACHQSWWLGSMEYNAVEFACGEGLALACSTGPDGQPNF